MRRRRPSRCPAWVTRRCRAARSSSPPSLRQACLRSAARAHASTGCARRSPRRGATPPRRCRLDVRSGQRRLRFRVRASDSRSARGLGAHPSTAAIQTQAFVLVGSRHVGAAADQPGPALGVHRPGDLVPRRLVRVRGPGRIHRGRHRLRTPRVARPRVVLAAVVPRLAAGRSGRRPASTAGRCSLVVSAAQALAASGLLLLAENRIWVAFVFQGLVAALAAFVKPCIDAAIPNLARDEDELRKANALMGSTWGVMLAVGAGLGGLFSQAFGRRASIVADVATFVVAGLVSRSSGDRCSSGRRRRSLRTGSGPIADMGEAIAVARRDKVILALMCSKATFAIGAGVVSQLAVLASDVFGSGDRGRGFLLAARGVGAGHRPGHRRPLGRRIAAPGHVLVRLGLARLRGDLHRRRLGADARRRPRASCSSPTSAAGANWTLSTYGLQRRVDDAVLGRVMAGDFAILTLVLSVTSVSAGLLSSARGSPVGDHRVRRPGGASPAPCIWFRPGRSARIWRPDSRQPPRTNSTADASHFTEHRERQIDSDRHRRATERRDERMTAYDSPPMDDVRTAEEVEQIFFELRTRHRRPEPPARTSPRGAAVARPLPARVGPRPGQDARRRDVVEGRRRIVRPHPVHARPPAVRHRRHPHLPRQQRALRRRARPGVRQLPADRRDQPRAGQGAVGAARGDGRGPGDDRRDHPPGAQAVLRRRHPEPDRERGRVPAARRAARPLHDEGRPRAPERRRGDGDPRPHGDRAARSRSR